MREPVPSRRRHRSALVLLALVGGVALFLGFAAFVQYQIHRHGLAL